MEETHFGTRNKRGHYIPTKRVGYPPVFVWPPKPVKAIKWIFSIPGYFFPWNTFYVIIGLISWFWFSPSLETFSNFSSKGFLLLFLRNSFLVTLYFGAFHFRLYFQQKQGLDFKFNPNWPAKNNNQFLFGNQNTDNIILTFASGVFIWTMYEFCIFWLAANSWINIISAQDYPIYFLIVIFLIHLWRDLHFYLIHRLIHWSPLYKLAHYVHHKNSNPGPWSGLAMHPIEHILYFSCVLIFLLIPFHPAFAVITLIHAGLSPAPGHAGFERIKMENEKSYDIDSYAHYLHHKYFECNYADGIIPLDKWFGTLHDGSEDSQRRLKQRSKEKSLKKVL